MKNGYKLYYYSIKLSRILHFFSQKECILLLQFILDSEE